MCVRGRISSKPVCGLRTLHTLPASLSGTQRGAGTWAVQIDVKNSKQTISALLCRPLSLLCDCPPSVPSSLSKYKKKPVGENNLRFCCNIIGMLQCRKKGRIEFFQDAAPHTLYDNRERTNLTPPVQALNGVDLAKRRESIGKSANR